MRNVALILIIGLLGACSAEKTADAPAGTQAITGSVDSNVRNLQLGMTEARVGRIIGAHQFESFDPSDGSISCRSYEYDETIDRKFVHVFYQDRRVAGASDGHKGFCNFGGDVIE